VTNVAEHAWIVDHRDDLDADFLAIYGIDLEAEVVGAKRFLALAARTPAYDGAMAAVVADQQHKEPAQTASSNPDEPQQVDVDAMNLIVPGLIDRVEV
jgi:hypothetical protein